MRTIEKSYKLISYEQYNQKDESQTHVHEFLGSVRIAEVIEDPHNHRFACVTGQVIPLIGGNHKHEVVTRTDFYEDHFHKICDVTGPAITGPAIKVGNRHVHFVEGSTSKNEGHFHEYIFATLINDPIGE